MWTIKTYIEHCPLVLSLNWKSWSQWGIRTDSQVLGLPVSLLAEKLLMSVTWAGVKAALVSQSCVIHGHLWAVIKGCPSSSPEIDFGFEVSFKGVSSPSWVRSSRGQLWKIIFCDCAWPFTPDLTTHSCSCFQQSQWQRWPGHDREWSRESGTQHREGDV